jgi:hypothetical protein
MPHDTRVAVSLSEGVDFMRLLVNTASVRAGRHPRSVAGLEVENIVFSVHRTILVFLKPMRGGEKSPADRNRDMSILLDINNLS